MALSCVIVTVRVADIFSVCFLSCDIFLHVDACAEVLGTDVRFGNTEPERRKENWNVPLNSQVVHSV